MATLAGACKSPIGVRESDYDAVYQRLTTNALEGDKLSDASSIALARHGLRDLFEEDPEQALRILHGKTLSSGRRTALFSLSELSYHAAGNTRNRDLYLAAAVYAYLFLFSEVDPVPANPYDARFRVACDLYNRGLARALTAEDEAVVVLEEQVRNLPFGRITIHSSRPGFPWGPEDFNRFLPADAFEVRGLTHRIRDSGLGVPLISIPHEDQVRGRRLGEFMPRTKVPATAFLRIEGDLAELRAGEVTASLELYSTFDVPKVDVAGRTVPLESDQTAPLAHSLEQSRVWDLGLAGFLSSKEHKQYENGIYMMQPYAPGKVPVVFVHGTASHPARWAAMFNGLKLDQSLRSHYQYWVFSYNTGNPVVYSAAVLRSSLEHVLRTLDPESEDPALQEMVVVGHSQGGLLTRMLTADSGTGFWDSFTDKKFTDVDLDEEQLDLVRRCFFFERSGFVNRAVFISTPHGGSFVAGNWIGRFFAKMITIPKNISSVARRLIEEDVLPPDYVGRLPTSITSMSPNTPFIRALADFPIDHDVKVHSIVAVRGSGDPTQGNDGVVAYESAHLKGADSEFVVRSGHSCQADPQVIGEVRRILLEAMHESP